MRFYRPFVAAALLAGVAGCSSPLERASTEELRHSIVDAARREVEGARASGPADIGPMMADREPGGVQFSDRELQRLEDEGFRPPSAYGRTTPGLGPDLLGGDSTTFQVSLEQAIGSALRHNLAVESARLAPAISDAQVTEAQAAFDWIFFASGEWSKVDRENQVPLVGGIPVGSAGTRSESLGFETGLRRRLTSNGTFAVTAGQTRSELLSRGTSLDPDPAQSTFVQFDLTQPLLRDLGSDIALAEVRFAENEARADVHRLHATLINNVLQVERAYWQLYGAMRVLQIQYQLLERGIATRDHLENRGYDTTSSQVADARATVENRRAAILRAAAALRQRSDELKRLINDPQLTVGSEIVLLPIDDPLDESIRYSLPDALTTAFATRPEVHLALLAIDDSSIRQRIADNARLPLLDLGFQARYQGLDRDTDEAWEDVNNTDYANYVMRLNFEQAIGNRAAEAAYRRAQLERVASTVQYRQSLQDITLEIKTALRTVLTNYRLIEQARSTRLAAAESLRTHRAREQLDGLTPTNLDLRFRRQESLAAAEVQEVQALLDYNTAIAALYAAMGTALERNGIRFDVEE
ncbi:MAG: TolC family protein [Phycisphaerales bacterium]|nr:TolC family protein [Phycisphaerales bacterium]